MSKKPYVFWLLLTFYVWSSKKFFGPGDHMEEFLGPPLVFRKIQHGIDSEEQHLYIYK